MTCKHHPDYKPESEEPHGKSFINKKGDVDFPCPYCWQARAKWLDEQLRLRTKRVAELWSWWEPADERITELDKQLAYFKDPMSAIDSSQGCPACKWEDGVITKRCWTHDVAQLAVKEAEKREAVLVEALEEIKVCMGVSLKRLRAGKAIKNPTVVAQPLEAGIKGAAAALKTSEEGK